MKRCELYMLRIVDIDKFVIRRTDHYLVFLIFGLICKMKISRILSAENIFFYITIVDNKPVSIIGDVKERWEFKLLSERFNLIEEYKKQNLKTPKEGRAMFSNYKITAIEFSDIQDVALETALEKLASKLDGVELKEKGEKTFLVKDGAAIELNGKDFQSLISRYVIGKTEAELTRNASMFELIKTLGIIKSATVEKVQGDLSSIFG